jgi:hypothetical protein
MTSSQRSNADTTRDPDRPARLLRTEHDALMPILRRTPEANFNNRRRAQAGRFAMC